MNARTVIPVTSLSEFVVTAGVGRAFRAMLPMLILSWPVEAWCQIPRSLAGVPLPQKISQATREVPGQTSAIRPDARARQQRRAQMAANAAAAIPADRLAATLATANYSFVLINVPNAAFVQPNAINDAGLVAGYYFDASYNSHGFTWQNGTADHRLPRRPRNFFYRCQQ
jgi:hypothetical protein